MLFIITTIIITSLFTWVNNRVGSALGVKKVTATRKRLAHVVELCKFTES